MHTPTAFILRCAASPPPTFTLPISPLPSPSFPPLNIARPHTLSKYISFSLSSRYLLSFCYRFSSTSVPLSFLASLLPLRASPCISFGLFLYRASLYRAPARYRPLFYTYTRVYIFTILDLYGIKLFGSISGRFVRLIRDTRFLEKTYGREKKR